MKFKRFCLFGIFVICAVFSGIVNAADDTGDDPGISVSCQTGALLQLKVDDEVGAEMCCSADRQWHEGNNTYCCPNDKHKIIDDGVEKCVSDPNCAEGTLLRTIKLDGEEDSAEMCCPTDRQWVDNGTTYCCPSNRHKLELPDGTKTCVSNIKCNTDDDDETGYCYTDGEYNRCHVCSAGFECPQNTNGFTQKCLSQYTRNGGGVNGNNVVFDLMILGIYGVRICTGGKYSGSGATECSKCNVGFTTVYDDNVYDFENNMQITGVSFENATHPQHGTSCGFVCTSSDTTSACVYNIAGQACLCPLSGIGCKSNPENTMCRKKGNIMCNDYPNCNSQFDWPEGLIVNKIDWSKVKYINSRKTFKLPEYYSDSLVNGGGSGGGQMLD